MGSGGVPRLAVDEEPDARVGAQPLRVALTYRKDSPGLFEVMEVLGKRTTLERIEKAREWIKNKT